MKQRFSEEQIISFIKEQESGITVASLCRKHGFSPATFYKWNQNTVVEKCVKPKDLKA